MSEVWIKVKKIGPGVFSSERVVTLEGTHQVYRCLVQMHNLREDKMLVRANLLEERNGVVLISIMAADPYWYRITVPTSSVVREDCDKKSLAELQAELEQVREQVASLEAKLGRYKKV
jgi:hypothetical protein